jgi:antitoxin CptB
MRPGADISHERRYMSFARPVRAFGVGLHMTGTARSSDGLDARRRRLLYRAWHRGMRETDLIMGRFADASIEQLAAAELADFEQLMDVPDRELLAWVTGEADVPPNYDTALFRRLREFNRSGGGAR